MTQNCTCHGAGGHLSQTVAAVLERPRYSPGLILEDSDLTAAVDYTRALNRLLFRNLFGCGVICGLNVKVAEKCGLTVTVTPGLALDGCGDPIELPKEAPITIDDNELRKWRKEERTKFWVVLCGKEKFCRPRSLVCDSDDFDGAVQHTRIRAQVEITIVLDDPKCVCRCPTRSKEGRGATREGAGNAYANQQSTAAGNAEKDPCQQAHEERDECAPDCGCGSACECGCCVLLAEVELLGEKWTAKHKGFRRLIRPKLIPDLDDPRTRDDEPRDEKEQRIIGTDTTTGAPIEMTAMMARIRDRFATAERVPETISLADLGIARQPENAEIASAPKPEKAVAKRKPSPK